MQAILKTSVAIVLLLGLTTTAFAQGGMNPEGFVPGDPRPDAPELAPRGEYQVGVQTVEWVNPDQIDLLNYVEGEDIPRYDRPLTLDIWYPAVVPEGVEAKTDYASMLGRPTMDPERPTIPFNWPGRALRDAEPDMSATPYPLVIVAHGYPGNRYLMTYLTENLASKGYVVIAADHTDSTYTDGGVFASTLLNRPLDILFMIDKAAELGDPGSDSFLAGLVDANTTGIVGYSMGGYGAVNVAGGGFTQAGVDLSWGVPAGLLSVRQAGNPDYLASMDDRIKAVVALAPWGRNAGFWDAETLAGITLPMLFIAGDADNVSGYENGTYKIYEEAVNADRYMLTFIDARHNVAPNPAPPEAWASAKEFSHFAEAVWDSTRRNNIVQHFVTAFLGIHLKGMDDYAKYLDVQPQVASEGDEENFWTGFLNADTSMGLIMEHSAPAQ